MIYNKKCVRINADMYMVYELATFVLFECYENGRKKRQKLRISYVLIGLRKNPNLDWF